MSFTLHSYGIFHLTLFKKFVMSLEKDYFDHVVLSFLAFFTINSDIKTWDTNYSKSSIHSRRTNILILFNPLVPIAACLYSLKTSENLWFSHVFRGYKKAALGTNGLINIWKKTKLRKFYLTLPGWPTCACSYGKFSNGKSDLA